jgi:hypothetical protein
VALNSELSFLVFCVNDLFIDESGVLESPTIIMLWSICVLVSTSTYIKKCVP